MERYDEALTDLNRAIELDPSADWAIADRGETYRLMERYDEALADFNRAIELDPSDAWAIASRGADLPGHGTLRRGPGRPQPRHRTRPQHAWAISHRGETYRLMGRYDEALADLNRAIELDPETPGQSEVAARPTGRWDATTTPWPTTTAPSNSTPATMTMPLNEPNSTN